MLPPTQPSLSSVVTQIPPDADPRPARMAVASDWRRVVGVLQGIEVGPDSVPSWLASPRPNTGAADT
jgi:hypothetical protein